MRGMRCLYPRIRRLRPAITAGLQGKFSRWTTRFPMPTRSGCFHRCGYDYLHVFQSARLRWHRQPRFYGGVSFDSVPLAPSATVYVDVDETSSGGGTPGLYFLLAAGHSFAVPHPVVSGVDLSAGVGFANSGFGGILLRGFRVGRARLQLHGQVFPDPGRELVSHAFVAYSALLGISVTTNSWIRERSTWALPAVRAIPPIPFGADLR